MANVLIVRPSGSKITWRKGNDHDCFHLTLTDNKGKTIGKAKLTADQLHKYICMNNTLEVK